MPCNCYKKTGHGCGGSGLSELCFICVVVVGAIFFAGYFVRSLM